MIETINSLISFSLSKIQYRLVFTIISALLFATTLPFVGFNLYAWIAIIPLIILIKSSDSYKISALESFLFFFIYNGISFIWLWGLHPLNWQGFSTEQSLLISFFAWILPTAFHSLVAVIFAMALKAFYDFRTNQRTYELEIIDVVFLSFLWVVLNQKLILNLGPDLGLFTIPINFLAYSQYKNHVIIQIANIIGAIGLEFFIVMVNLSISNIFNIQAKSSGGGRSFIKPYSMNIKLPFYGLQEAGKQFSLLNLVLVSLILFFVYGLFEINSDRTYKLKHANEARTFASIQPDFIPAATRTPSANYDNIFALENKLTAKLKDKDSILIYPEGSVPVLDKRQVYETVIEPAVQGSSLFIFGTYTKSNGSIYNSIEFRKTNEIQHYHKSTLVPFGEYTPLYNYLPGALKQLATSTVGVGFDASPVADEPVIMDGLKMASSVCFELLFPKIVRSQVNNGANIILNLNDLSWFNNIGPIHRTWVKKEFLAAGVFRAIENKRPTILSANAGYSALIAPTGKIEAITKANAIEILQGEFIPRDSKSLYTQYGW